MKRILFTCLSIFLYSTLIAQDFTTWQKEFDAFTQAKQKEFDNFKDRVNQEYADFLRQSWEQFNRFTAIVEPQEEPVPPVVITDEDLDQEPEDNPIHIEEIIDIPEPTPQPTPIEPIKPEPQPIEKEKFRFMLYGTEMQISLTNKQRFTLTTLEEETIAQAWERLSQSDYNNVINECLTLRDTKKLCDWSYLRMLDAMSDSFFGDDTNESELLKAYIYCQSGYQMRLAIMDNHLAMLYGSQHTIYRKSYWVIDDTYYYSDYSSEGTHAYICDAPFPNEKALSLYVTEEQQFLYKPSKMRTLQSSDQPWLRADVVSDMNLLAFCESYPSSCINRNSVTQWAMYANKPLSSSVQEVLYPHLRECIADKSPVEAVNILCHWVQTAFVYEYDDKVWGGERTFFAEETLYYPYADCEDRSILFTRIVRDLLGLECAIVDYPGHLATAVALGDDAKGDYIMINNKRFLICDPTYIGAQIGRTMPGMDNATAKVLLLN